MSLIGRSGSRFAKYAKIAFPAGHLGAVVKGVVLAVGEVGYEETRFTAL